MECESEPERPTTETAASAVTEGGPDEDARQLEAGYCQVGSAEAHLCDDDAGLLRPSACDPCEGGVCRLEARGSSIEDGARSPPSQLDVHADPESPAPGGEPCV